MKYPIILSYYIVSLIVTLIPLPWWYYSVGGLFQIYDSPFQINLILLNSSLAYGQILNILLNAFRIYVAINLIYGIVLIFRNKLYRYSTMFWLPIFYFVDPIVIYIITNYVISNVIHFPVNYPLLVIGKENLVTSYQNTTINMLIISEPTLIFWVSLISPILYLASLVLEHKNLN